MAEVKWTLEAARWLEDIYKYIAADDPEAAEQTVRGIQARAKELEILGVFHEALAIERYLGEGPAS